MRNYPDFMFSNRPTPLIEEIPVFVFHSVEPVDFEQKLRFLAQNGYRTLTGEEFRAAIAGENMIPDRSVLLTFDDGMATLWTVAFPLLRKYGFRAVSFLVPGCIPEQAPEAPSFLDYERARVPLTALLAREQSAYLLCSWEEVREMHASGVIDFQSHTMYHDLICVSPRLVDFIHPSSEHYSSVFNIPVYRVNGSLDFSRRMMWGTPVYRFEPRMAGKPQYFDNEKIRSTCTDYVCRHGGKEFFKQETWWRQLYQVFHKAQKQDKNGKYENCAEQRKAIFEDLWQSKKVIEEHLPGKIIDQLCYPWFVGSQLSVQQAKVAGYRLNFWGVIPGRKTNRSGDNLFYVPRIDQQYIYRLPGRGRKSLREILITKLRANFPNFVKRLKN